MELMKKDLVMTSLEIAEITGKNHADVMRDIRSEIESLELEGLVGESIFALSSYKSSQGKDVPMFTMGRDGAMQIATRYSAVIRRKLIMRLDELENSTPKLPTTFKEALLMLVEAEEEKEQLQLELSITNAKIIKDEPLVDFANKVANSSDSIDIGDFSKVLHSEEIKIGRNTLFSWLRENKYIMKNNIPYQKYVDNGYFEVIEVVKTTPWGDKVFAKTLITGKGQIYLVQKLRDFK